MEKRRDGLPLCNAWEPHLGRSDLVFGPGGKLGPKLERFAGNLLNALLTLGGGSSVKTFRIHHKPTSSVRIIYSD